MAGTPVAIIRESERLFRTVAGSVPTIVWMDDTDGRCIYLNKTWCEFTGLTEDQGLGEGWADSVHPDDRLAFRTAFLAAVARQEAFRAEYRLRRHDGEWRWVIDSATPIIGADGAFHGHVGSVLDITERKQVEAALSENEEKLRLAVDATELGLWDFHIASGALAWNQRLKEIYGLPPDTEVTYEIYRSCIHADDRDRVKETYEAALDPDSSGRFRFEHRVVGREDGAIRWVQAAGLVIFDTRSPVRVLGTVRDITDRKSAEERQTLLMAELDHRVRNILASIQAMISLTGHSAATKEDYAAALQGRVAAMARAHDLLTRRHWEGADLADVVHDGLQAYGEAVIVGGPQGCVLRAKDALNAALVLHELATNAAKYGALSVPEGRVHVTWTRGDTTDLAQVHIAWRETGGPEVSPPARRGFGSQLIQTAVPGTQLQFEPAGVRCDMTLKLRQREATRKTKTAGAHDPGRGEGTAGTAPLSGLRLLVVEDDPITALALQSILSEAGVDMMAVARTLHEAWTHAESDISAAVLDVNLDGEMVYPLAQRIVARRIPTVFVTGYDLHSTLPEGLRGVPTLQKPVDSAALIRRLVEMTRSA